MTNKILSSLSRRCVWTYPPGPVWTWSCQSSGTRWESLTTISILPVFKNVIFRITFYRVYISGVVKMVMGSTFFWSLSNLTRTKTWSSLVKLLIDHHRLSYLRVNITHFEWVTSLQFVLKFNRNRFCLGRIMPIY